MVSFELKSLVQLQRLDSFIIEKQDRIAAIPEETHALEEELRQHQEAFDRLQTEAEQEKQHLRDLELELEKRKDQRAKTKTHLMEVKTNKEYQAVLSEIDTIEKGIAGIEDGILEYLLKLDESEAALQGRRQGYEQEQQELLKQKRELEAASTQFEAEIEQLQEERDSLLHQISSELAQRYDRIALARGGVALAEAKDQSCQMCHVKLRPQLFADIRSGRDIITCENCNRILYFQDE